MGSWDRTKRPSSLNSVETELVTGRIRVWFDTVQASVGEKWGGSGARKVEGSLGKVSGGGGKSHGGVNRRQGLEGEHWDVQGKGISGGLGYFLHSQLPPLLLLWGNQEDLHG